MTPAFSDIGPLAEYSIFVAILAMSVVAVGRLGHVAEWLGRALQAIAKWTKKRKAFPDTDVARELRRIDIARIALGILATSRYSDTLVSASHAGSQEAVILSAIGVILSLMILTGFLTPIAMLLLMSTANILIDNMLGASTLGTMILSISLLSLLIVPAGRTLSVDAYIFKRRGTGSSLINSMYRLFGSVSSDRIIIGKLAGALAYYCLCLYSVSWHIRDPAWLSGYVLSWIMLSPAANPHYSDLAWDAYQYSPFLFVNFFRLSILGMVLWYVLFLPGMFAGKLARTVIIFWGLAFFLISTFVLPLSYLGWYELVFWFFLYVHFPAFSTSGKRNLSILFDDRCNLCDRTVKALSWIDVFGALTFLPIRRNLETASRFNVSLEEGLTDLVGIEEATGRRFDGYALYETLATRLFFLWPAWPFLWLGRQFHIGPAIYRFIADRRTKLFGVCEFSTIPDRFTRFSTKFDINPREATATFSVATKGILLTLLIMVILFGFRLPILTPHVDEKMPGSWVRATFGSAPLAFGIGKIDVFNSSDLSLFNFQFSGVIVPKIGTEVSNSSFDNGAPITGRIFAMGDQQRYTIIKYSRVMSRKDLGCDMDFWDNVSKLYTDALISSLRSIPDSDLLITVKKAGWPTEDDFRTYRNMSPELNVLCTGRIDTKSGELEDLTFDQAGIDATLNAKKYPAYLKAETALIALNYKCRIDAAWLNVLILNDLELAARPGLVATAKDLYNQRYGEFQIGCMSRVIKIMQENRDLDEHTRTRNDPELCEIGIRMSKAHADAAAPDAVFHAKMKRMVDAAVDAQLAGNTRLCIASGASARRLYFEHITKAESHIHWETPLTTTPNSNIEDIHVSN